MGNTHIHLRLFEEDGKIVLDCAHHVFDIALPEGMDIVEAFKNISQIRHGYFADEKLHGKSDEEAA